jgi:hypothetical protein
MFKEPVWGHEEEGAAVEEDFCSAIVRGMQGQAKVVQKPSKQLTAQASHTVDIKVSSLHLGSEGMICDCPSL